MATRSNAPASSPHPGLQPGLKECGVHEAVGKQNAGSQSMKQRTPSGFGRRSLQFRILVLAPSTQQSAMLIRNIS
jgi:hypothetical protein